MSSQKLRIPQGTEAFYLEEAYVHRELLRRFEDVCSSWAYLPVTTPVFDFHDLYRGLAEAGTDNSYRLVDRDGDILVLRSDITLFLARQMGMIVQDQDLPIRVYYGDTILRHEDPTDLSKNEFFQIGAELIGNGGVDADSELVLLLLETADALGMSNSALHIGSRGLVRLFHPGEPFARSVAGRDWHEAARHLESAGAGRDRVASILQLFRFIGTSNELRSNVDLSALGAEPARELDHLLSVSDALESVGYGARVRIDLSEIGDRPYYSGIVFHLYGDGADAPIAAGGRYDELLGRFGTSAPSVGFSLMLRRLQSRLPPGSLPRMPVPERASGQSFADRVEAARTDRRNGKVVRL